MLLAVDTATRLISLALHDGQTVAAESTWHTAGHHTVELAPQVALLLRRAGTDASRLKGLAVAIGPGSYTGLRIGLGFAKGLALAQSIPLVGVSTFEALMRAQAPRRELAVAVLEAGRGRVSAARYRWNEQRRRWDLFAAARVLDWPALAASIEQPTYVCGEIDAHGAEALRERTRRGLAFLATPAHNLRRAGFLAEIGWERLRAPAEAADAVANAASRLAPIYGSTPEGAPPQSVPLDPDHRAA
jgi:tRNA threonylcarbamoyladenosine biosynthesis protein TsaB